MEFLDRLTGKVSTAANLMGVTILSALALLVTVNIVMRYLFNAPIRGTFELVELMLVTALFLGLPYTTRIRGHISADFLSSRMPLHLQNLFDLFTALFSTFITSFMSFSMFEMASRHGAAGDVTGMLHIPLLPFRYLSATALGLLSIGLLLQSAGLLLKMFQDEEQDA
ncbi:MAG: TRAP transporter small permease [Alphaproteobacteria bacterium]|nr:MAG: TRAP transporter small permease [Alphaproteobacteria bacterium]